VTIRDSSYSPEDQYGHGLKIVDNQNIFNIFSSAEFTNRLSVFNPSPGFSRPGYIELKGLCTGFGCPSGTNRFVLPTISGGSSVTVDVGGAAAYVDFAGGVSNVFATIYEVSGFDTNFFQPQDSQLIYAFNNSSPPSGGVPYGGSSSPAPGFTPPPKLTNAIVTGPSIIEENSLADYLSTAFFDNGTTSTNTATAWSSSLFDISSSGRLTVGTLSSDALAIIAGTVSYGTVTKTVNFSTLIAHAIPLRLQAVGPSSDQFRLQLSGTTGRHYTLEGAPNITSGSNTWSVIVTNIIPTNSTAQLNDPGYSTNRTRFYRARQMQ